MTVFINYILPLMIGSLMGLGTHALRNNNLLKKPKINKASYNLGFLLDCGFGAVASLIAVIVANPNEIRLIVFISVLAGFAGESFIRNMAENNLPVNFKASRKNDEQINEIINYEDDKKEKKE